MTEATTLNHTLDYPPKRIRSKWHFDHPTTLTVLGVLGILALNIYAPANPTLTERLVGSAGLCLSMIPVILWLRSTSLQTAFLPFFCGVYAISYILPIFILQDYVRAVYIQSRAIPHEYVEEALLLSVVGLACMFFGYSWPSRFNSGLLPKIRMQWRDIEVVKWVAVVVGMVGLTSYYARLLLPIPIQFSQFLVFLGDCAQLSIIMLLVLQMLGRLPLNLKIFLWCFLFPNRVAIGLGTGLTSQALEIAVTALLTYSTLSRRIPVFQLSALFLLLTFILLPIRAEFRALTWVGTESARNPLEKAAIYLSTAQDFVDREGLFNPDSGEHALSRLSHLMTFAEVVALTPEIVPFWGGETYYPLLFKPIPRLLYPDKPREVTGQTFGHRYSFLGAEDDITSYNLPQLIEFYSNFGAIGVIVGMFFIGMLYRTVEGMFIHEHTGLGALASSIYLGVKLLVLESSLSLVLGGLLWSLIFLCGIQLVFKWMEQTTAGVR